MADYGQKDGRKGDNRKQKTAESTNKQDR